MRCEGVCTARQLFEWRRSDDPTRRCLRPGKYERGGKRLCFQHARLEYRQGTPYTLEQWHEHDAIVRRIRSISVRGAI